MKKNIRSLILLSFILAFGSIAALPKAEEYLDPTPPDETQKLVFIHHSCGENWLSDDNGGLGQALGENNYFVSDTNYGWGPNSIGDATDIPDWPRWFRSDETPAITEALYNEFSNNWYGWEYYQRPMKDPGGENDIILFKSCYPNSELWGSPDDPAGGYADWTVAGAKYVYNDILHYFSQHPDKLFIVITAPPNLNKETAENARAFNEWLVNDWLMPYSGTNVAVWDFYAVLSHKENHHRFINEEVEHINSNGNGTAAYDSWGDPHPNQKGNIKATKEFIPLLNIYVNRWLSGIPAHVFPSGFEPQVNPSEPLAEEEIEQISPVDEETEVVVNTPSGSTHTDLVDNFDGELHWEAFHGETAFITCGQTGRVFTSEPYALEITAVVPQGDWASCEYYFDAPMNFTSSKGLTFKLNADTLDFPYTILIYSGDPGEPELFGYDLQTTEEQLQQWESVQIPWKNFNPVWSEEGVLDLTQVEGFVFAFGTDDDIEGKIAIEDLFIGDLEAPTQDTFEESVIEPDSDSIEEEPQQDNSIIAIREQICGGIFLIPLLPMILLLLNRRKAVN